MAETAYPKIPTSAWRSLRSKAASAPSTRFTAGTVAALLEMASPESAAGNIVRPLRQIGLINEEGGLTERGQKWRVDASYPQACQEILDDVYPDDLAPLTKDDGRPDKAKVKTWFEHKGFGASSAGQMAATYTLIAERTIPEPPAPAAPKKDSGQKRDTRAAAPPADLKATSDTPEVDAHKEEHSGVGERQRPNIHLDIQIHISASASAEQIDQIFASMAKHLYPR